MSQIAGDFQKMIFESSTLLHIIPFAKIIGPVEKKIAKSEFSPIVSLFEIWNFSPLNTCKIQIFLFAFISIHSGHRGTN